MIVSPKNLSKTQTENFIRSAVEDFAFFTNHIFALSFCDFNDQAEIKKDNFVRGEHVNNMCYYLQENNKTIRVSAKDHFKSTSFYSHIMWNLFRNPHKNIENHYFSYKTGMANYHIGDDENKDNIKSLISRNPFFEDVQDLRQDSSTRAVYTWDGVHKFSISPKGMLSAKRGLHFNGVGYVDDPLQDPAQKIEPAIVLKINNIFRTQLMDMPQYNRGGQLHVVGTAQTKDDFYFDSALENEGFKRVVLPAIVSYDNKQALWPEWKDFNTLISMKASRGEKVFNQEYMCIPVYSENSYFKDEQISEIMTLHNNLPYNQPYETKNNVLAGFDIGKKAHPSHFMVLEEGEDGIYRNIHQIFMDKWPYTRQIEYLRTAIENLQIDFLHYDDTRGEFEGFRERGDLPAEMKPVSFTYKKKHELATQLDKLVSSNKILLIEDQRLKNQIITVTNDLKAIETAEGHGDAFWSTCLALASLIEAQPGVGMI